MLQVTTFESSDFEEEYTPKMQKKWVGVHITNFGGEFLELGPIEIFLASAPDRP
jgi:hypothetical protein